MLKRTWTDCGLLAIGALGLSAWIGALGLSACSSLSSTGSAPDPGAALQEIVQYGPPYTMAKMTQACAQPKTDMIASMACTKLEIFAAACAGDINAQAQLVDLGIGIVGGVATATGQGGVAAGAAAATVANNNLVVPAAVAAQLAACGIGGFPVGSAPVAASPAPAAAKN